MMTGSSKDVRKWKKICKVYKTGNKHLFFKLQIKFISKQSWITESILRRQWYIWRLVHSSVRCIG